LSPTIPALVEQTDRHVVAAVGVAAERTLGADIVASDFARGDERDVVLRQELGPVEGHVC
jgi:hypothetical protein